MQHSSSLLSSPPDEVLRLMLHTEDGMIPFLTPDLLQQYFPPSTLWCLGIAVNETCITPIFATHNPPNMKIKKKKQQKKRNIEEINTSNTDVHKENDDSTRNDDPITTTATTQAPTARKPRGYTFSSTGGLFQLDEWLYPYTRIAIPTFHNGKKSTNNKPSLSKNDGTVTTVSKGTSSSSSSLSLTDMRLWTSNGRHSITTLQYMDCAANAIHAHFIVPLFPLDDDEEVEIGSTLPSDTSFIPPIVAPQQSDTMKQHEFSPMEQYEHKQHEKTRSLLGNQKLIVSQHTEAVQKMNEPPSATATTSTPSPLPQLCVPLLVSDRYCYFMNHRHNSNPTTDHPTNDDECQDKDAAYDKLLLKENTTRAHLQWMIDDVRKEYSISSVKTNGENRNSSTIIMMIGWHTIVDMNHRWHLLKSLHWAISTLSPSFTNTEVSPRTGSIPPPLTLGTVSTWSTQQLLQLIEYTILGNDSDNQTDTKATSNHNSTLIGTNLPTIWAKMKRCFVIDTSMEVDDDATTSSPSVDADGCYDFTPPTEMKHVQDHIFYADARPLMKNCTCITCTTYTRAYLYHLVCAQEILVEILFFIHNFHHMLHLIRVVNTYHTNNDIDAIQKLCLSIKSQLQTSKNE